MWLQEADRLLAAHLRQRTSVHHRLTAHRVLLQLAAPEEKDERKAATDADRAKRAIKARKKGRVSALVAEAADGAETDPESAATPVGSVAKAAMANGDGTGDDHNGSKVHAQRPYPMPDSSLLLLHKPYCYI